VSIASRRTALQPSRLWGTFASLVGSQLGVAVFGLVFWTIAARELTPKQVGVGAALVAVMTLLSMFGVLGVGTLLLERFKVVSVSDRRVLLSTGLIVALIGGALFAATWSGFTALVHIPGALGSVSLVTSLLLIASTGIAALCFSFDQAVIGMGASGLQLRRNLLASVLRIALLFGATELGMKSGQVILACWTLGLVGSLLATPLQGHLSPRVGVGIKQRYQLVRHHGTAAIGHHSLTLAMVSSSLLLPVVAASMMSATENAYFAQARLLAEPALALPYFLTIALFAAANSEDDFRQKARRTLVLGMALAIALIIGAALTGRFLLLAFGTSYSHESLPLLCLLLAAGIPLVIKDHFVVLRRIQGMRKQGAVAIALWTAAELTGAITGGLLGGPKVFLVGWLVMSVACAILAIPVLRKALKRPPTGALSSANTTA
jgi:O-antigen/teichoic acid export membrane protein